MPKFKIIYAESGKVVREETLSDCFTPEAAHSRIFGSSTFAGKYKCAFADEVVVEAEPVPEIEAPKVKPKSKSKE